MQTQKRKKVWFYDIEQLSNFHSNYFISKDGTDHRCFVIHESRNDIDDYIEFLETEVKSLIGFNNLEYDYPMVHYILNDLQYHRNEFDDANLINELLKTESDRIIAAQFSSIPQWEVQIPQLDIFKILHFDNPNNKCSLKKAEFVIRFDNVDDIDVSKIKYVATKDISKILSYNKNDVLATKKMVENCSNEIELRKEISKLYKHYSSSGYTIDWMNFNDAKIGAEIFTVPIADRLGITVRELKQLRTHRDRIVIKDIILPYVNFKSKEFNKVLNQFNKEHITTTKDSFDYKQVFKGIEYVYGFGGLHGCISPGKYYSDENHHIIEVDVK